MKRINFISTHSTLVGKACLLLFVVLLFASAKVNAQNYCVPMYSNGLYNSNIKDVILTGGGTNLSNTGTGYGLDGTGFSDYTHLKHIMQHGSSIGFTVNVGDQESGQPSQYWFHLKIWIDKNNNHIFSDDEVFYSSPAINISHTGVLQTQTLPVGSYRMRFMVYNHDGSGTPCASEDYGEAEDYTLEVLLPCSGAVDLSGTIVTTDPTTANVGNSYQVKALGVPFFSGLSYIWEKSTDGGTNWATVYNSTTYQPINAFAPMGDVTTVNYRLKVACQTDTVTSDPTTFTTSKTYCTPSVYWPSLHIKNVETNGGISNISNLNTGIGLNWGYSDYTAQQVVILPDTELSFAVVTSDPLYIAIWIDRNQNGDFEESERVYMTVAREHLHEGVLKFNGWMPGNYRIRILISTEEIISACVNDNFGEIEDYTLVIQSITSCSGMPNAGKVSVYPLAVAVDHPYEVTVSGASTNSDLTYIWENSIDGGATWTASVPYATYTHFLGQIAPSTAESEVFWRLKVACLTDTAISNVATLTTIAEPYCKPILTFNDYFYIKEFHTSNAVSDLHNVTNAKSPNGYGDFSSSHVLQVTPGMKVDFNTVIAENGSMYGLAIWVDWNKNGVFEANEVLTYSTSGPPYSPTQGSFYIPTNQVAGTYLMRVLYLGGYNDLVNVLGNGVVIGPCATPVSSKTGEIEEYALEILEVTACSGLPSGGTLSLSTQTAKPGDAYSVFSTGYSINSGLDFSWYASSDGGATWQIQGTPNTTYAHLYNQIAPPNIGDSVMYFLQVSCENNTANSDTITFKTELVYCKPIFWKTGNNKIIHHVLVESNGSTLIDNSTVNVSPLVPYSDYSDQEAIVSQGDDVDFTVTLAGNNVYHLHIYIDINQNGAFESLLNEKVHQSTDKLTTHTFTLSTNNILPGSYRMRFLPNSNNIEDIPCGNNNFIADVEDYTLVVLPSSTQACSGTPTAGTINLTATTAPPGTLYGMSAQGTSTEQGLLYTWIKSVNDQAWIPASNIYSSYAPLHGQIAPSDTSQVVKYRLVVTCGTETDSSNIVQFQSSLNYCTPTYTQPNRHVSKIETTEGLLNLNNPSGSGLNGYGYSDYTDQQLIVETGKNIWFQMTFEGASMQVSVYIDVNKNGIFEPVELYYLSNFNSNYSLADSLLISDLPEGTYRIRFIGFFAGHLPCQGGSIGEAEDYTLMIGNFVPCSGLPTIGTIHLSATTASPNDLYNVIATNVPSDSDLAYIWEKSTDGSTTWIEVYNDTVYENLNGEIAPPNISDEVQYRFKVACQTDTATSNTVTFTTQWTYCSPNVTSPEDLYISDVITSGGTTNINNTNTAFGTNGSGYSDYTDQQVVVTEGFDFEISVKVANYPIGRGLVIAVDQNQDGQFDLNEALFNSVYPVQQSYHGILNVRSLPVGTYRMRIMFVEGGATSMCPVIEHGEAEDYTLVITPSTNCNGTPIAGTVVINPTSASINLTYDVSASGYSVASGLSFIWEKSTDGGTTWNQHETTTTYYVPLFDQVAPAELNDEVKWRLRVACGTDTVTSNLATFTTQAIYCTPSSFYTSEYTSDFHTTGGATQINYTASSQTGMNGYEDLTSNASQKVTQVAGQSFDFSHTHAGAIRTILAIWIDWNKNGAFEENERMFYGYNEPIVQTGTIAIPMHIPPDDYRMRMRVHRYPLSIGTIDLSPCTMEPYGQTLDFTLTVTPMSACSGTPSAGTISVNPPFANGGTEYVVSSSGYTANDELTFVWEKSTDAGTTWNAVGLPSPFYFPLVDTANMEVETTATYRLIVVCGIDSTLSNEVVFTTHKVYCTPLNISNPTEYISKFLTTNGLLNANYAVNEAPENSYIDLTGDGSQIISQYIGQSFDFSATKMPVNTIPPIAALAIWIDWNDNGTFEVNERVYEPIYQPQPFYGTITIPDTIQVGLYRMRVRESWSNSWFMLPDGACVAGVNTLDFHIKVLECIADAGSIVQGDVVLCAGEIMQLTATQTVGTHKWTSDNENVATIDENFGFLSGISGGTAQITYVLKDASGCTGTTTANVTVTDTTIVTFTQTPKLSEQQDTLTVEQEFDYVGTSSTATWTSSDQSVAVIDPNSGHLTALSDGQTTIKYTDQATCGGSASRILVVIAKEDDPVLPPPCLDPPCEGNNGIEEHDFVSNVSLFPNPANSEVNIEFTARNHTTITIELLDLNGKILETVLTNATEGTNFVQFNVSDYAGGIYSVMLHSNNSLTVKKLVIRK